MLRRRVFGVAYRYRGTAFGEIVRDAADRGAQAIIVACPMCHSNLDMRRQAIDSYLRRRIDVPVLYVTQAIGLAVGLSPRSWASNAISFPSPSN